MFLVLLFFGFLGVYEQRHKKKHGPELADADDGLCFLVFFGFFGFF